MKKPTSGHLMAYIGVAIGLAISTTANYMHAAHPGAAWWSPWLGGAWPLLLFVALEVLTRNSWGYGWTRVIAFASVGVVAAVAAVESYWHLRAMLISTGEETWLATIGPLAIDGLMTTSAAALLTGSRASAEPATESAHGVAQDIAEPVHTVPAPAAEPVHDVAQPSLMDQPTGPAHSAPPQVSALTRTAPAVSQDAIERVLKAVRSGQPMGKSQIVTATGMSRSTTTRAVDHLVALGQLTSVGEPHRPSYVMAQPAAHEVAQ